MELGKPQTCRNPSCSAGTLCCSRANWASQRVLNGTVLWADTAIPHHKYICSVYEAEADAVLATDFLDSRKPNMFCPTYTSVQKLLEAAVPFFRVSFI